VGQALSIYILAIPYNIYPILLILFTLFICIGLIPDFGPMKKAEERAKETGALIRPGSSPLLSETDNIDLKIESLIKPSVLFDLFIPVLLIIGVGVLTLIFLGTVKIVEAFMLAVTFLVIMSALKGRFKNTLEVGELITAGMKNVAGALLIIALAYSLNTVTTELGAADLIIKLFADNLSGTTLVILTFLITAIISFSTGTSWGAYAMTIPVVLPLAYDLTGGEITPLIYQTIAAIAGGGIFGDNASPVSDTTVLSSVGAGCDHIDHVITQLPYALLIGLISVFFYMLV
jgi:Na+/H+ antiporter NhaC